MINNSPASNLPATRLSALPSTFPAMASFANAVPMLSLHEENRLVHAWSSRQDIEAARELVLSHLRLVIKCVRDHDGYGMSREDMVQEGLVGLMKAVHRFRTDMGVRLGVFARHWIVAQIREYIFHNWRIVRLGAGKAMKKLFFGYRSTIERLARLDPGARPSLLDERAAMELGVEPCHVQQASSFLLGSDATLDVPCDAASSSATALVPWTGDGLEQMEHEDAGQHAARQLYGALEGLPDRDRDILEARYLRDDPEPLRVVAQRHGISIERVRQVEKKALEALRQLIRE